MPEMSIDLFQIVNSRLKDNFQNDISILKSLPQREIISGYGEILKHSLILDKKFFFWLLKNGKKIINEKNSIY